MDQALLERAKAGDREAIHQVLEEVAPLVLRFGLKMCRHEADAEDVLQDTLMSVTSHLSEFEGRSSLSSWVFMLARTACARKRRGLKNQAHLPEEASATVRSSAPTPEDEAEQQRMRQLLDDALAALSDEQREVLLLRDMEGLTAPEVAEALSITVEAVKSRLHRARAALRDALGKRLEGAVPVRHPGCPDILAAFSKKLEGDLASEDCTTMEKHMEGCATCSADCTALRGALWACRNEANHKVSPRLQARIRAAVNRLSAP